MSTISAPSVPRRSLSVASLAMLAVTLSFAPALAFEPERDVTIS